MRPLLSSCSQAVHKPQASLQHRLCLPAGGHSLSSWHQCALWTGSSPGSEEWLLPHPSPVGRKGRGVERGREVASAGGQVQAWPSTLPPFCLPSRPPFPLCPEARIGLFLPRPPPSSQTKDTAPHFLCWVPCCQDSQIPGLSPLHPYFFTVQGQFSASIGDSPLWGDLIHPSLGVESRGLGGGGSGEGRAAVPLGVGVGDLPRTGAPSRGEALEGVGSEVSS